MRVRFAMVAFGASGAASLALMACALLGDLQPLSFVDSTEAGPSEASLADGNEITDARADAIRDAGPDTRLAPVACDKVDAEFCDDFEDGNLENGPWTQRLAAQGAASVDISNSESLTPSSSLRAESLDSSAPFSAGLSKEWTAFTGRFFVAFDLFIRVPPSGGTFITQSFFTDSTHNQDDSADPTLTLFEGDGGTTLTAFNLRAFSPGQGLFLATIPTGKWTHIEATFAEETLVKNKVRVRYVVDYGTPIERTVDDRDAGAGKPFTLFGIQSGGSKTEIFYDNVVMDTR